jgi:phosphomannomutase/phosphoglucomutase
MTPLYQVMGFNPMVVNGTMNGSFSGRGPAPTEETLRDAGKIVRDSKADYGIGFDPDADRGIVIDDRGRNRSAREGGHNAGQEKI